MATNCPLYFLKFPYCKSHPFFKHSPEEDYVFGIAIETVELSPALAFSGMEIQDLFILVETLFEKGLPTIVTKNLVAQLWIPLRRSKVYEFIVYWCDKVAFTDPEQLIFTKRSDYPRDRVRRSIVFSHP